MASRGGQDKLCGFLAAAMCQLFPCSNQSAINTTTMGSAAGKKKRKQKKPKQPVGDLHLDTRGREQLLDSPVIASDCCAACRLRYASAFGFLWLRMDLMLERSLLSVMSQTRGAATVQLMIQASVCMQLRRCFCRTSCPLCIPRIRRNPASMALDH